MSFIRAIAALTVAFGILINVSEAEAGNECHKASERDIAALFDRWNSSLKTGDSQKVAANYADKSILLPTVSNKPRLTKEEKVDYFNHFLALKPEGKIDPTNRVIKVGCNSAFDAGLYTFTLGDGSTVSARYTYTYEWNGKEWLITSHHSSKMPEQPAQAAAH